MNFFDRDSFPGHVRALEYAVWFGFVVLVLYVLMEWEGLLVPLAIAIGLWYLITAMTEGFYSVRLGKIRLPRILCLFLALTTIGAFLYGVGHLISDNIRAVVQETPTYRARIEDLAAQIESMTGFPLMQNFEAFLRDINVGEWITSVASALTTVAGTTGLILIYVFFLLIEQETFDTKLKALIKKEERREAVRQTLATVQKRVRTYLWVKTLMSLFTGGASYAVMEYVGLDYAGFWAFIIFLLNYIPTIGSLLGIIFPSAMTLLQFDGYTEFAIVAGTITFFQVTIGNVLEPRMMGTQLNMSPLVVILSLALWGSVWGVTGLFLGVPIMAILIIFASQFEATRGIAIVLSSNGDIGPKASDVRESEARKAQESEGMTI
jgi:predicted PurR-regulated permease PerM